MLFNSFNFLIFFPLITALYYLLPSRVRWLLLLSASCIFYMFFIPEYILILVFTIVIDYFAGILIEQSKQERRKKWLIISLVANIGVLAVFKYYNFFNANLEALATHLGWNYGIPALAMVLPIGLSFHTFQAMSYTIEVYRGNQKAERHFGIYSLYVMYYPQLVAGPIERPQNLLPQFHTNHNFDYKNVTDGLKLMAWGLLKKVVIADRISPLINPVFDNPENYSGMSLAVAAVLFSFQIFCDFSGYSDIAIGSSQVMGIDLMRNFNRPYFSKTIGEFWTRWHISLSTWFKDYLYIPLGGNRNGLMKTYRNLIITFLISGFWHGANWNFIVWGALHAFYLVFAAATKKYRDVFRKTSHITRFHVIDNIIQTSTVFVLVTIAWIFFRANTVQKAWYMVTHIFSGVPDYFRGMLSEKHFLWLEPLLLNRYFTAVWFDFLILGIAILLMEFVHLSQRKGGIREQLSKKPFAFRWIAYAALIWIILLFGIYHDANEFIYFQF